MHGPTHWCLVTNVCLLSCVRLFVTPRTVVLQIPLSMEFSRQEYWSRFPFPTPGISPTLRLNPCLLPWQAGSLLQSHLGPLSKLHTNRKWDIANSILGPSTPRGQVNWLAQSRDQQIFSVNTLVFVGSFSYSFLLLQCESSKRQYINEQICCVPIKLYLLTLKFELHIIFMGHKLLLFFLFF